MNGIEKDLEGKSEVVRVSMLSSIGREIAAKHGVSGVPTTIVVSGQGDVVYRHSGIPDRKQVVSAAST